MLENANWFLYQLENPTSSKKKKELLLKKFDICVLAVEIGDIDEAAAEICQTIHQLVRDKPETWLPIVFQVGILKLEPI